ncbi:MAG: chromosome segregation protein ScpA [Nitrososphaeraceae archaeon]|nr:chromosome segregation protein ScpA [Nitrososphaeraceae archaeon]
MEINNSTDSVENPRSEENTNISKPISKPPLNLLFNPSLLEKKNVWEIKISFLLELLLSLINQSGSKDLRICGIAAWSSSLIYRLKVESIFNLEKIAMQRKSYEQNKEIPDLNILDFPFRVNSTYPVSLEDLLKVLENMISELANPRTKNKSVIEPIENFDFDRYLVKFEQILESYKSIVMDIIEADGYILFNDLVKNRNNLEIARFFLAILHLAMDQKIELIYNELNEDIKLVLSTHQKN